MIIRCEKEDDYKEIYELVKTAFETAKLPPDGEADYVNDLRMSDEYIPDFALVAEENGKLIGHIMLTKTFIKTEYEKTECLLLSPVCTKLEYRNKGVGAKLITEALNRARAAGYKAVFLVGDPNYYGRFGFMKVKNFNISYTMDIEEQYVLGCELYKNALKGIKGSISIV